MSVTISQYSLLLEKATNQLLVEVAAKLPAMLDAVDTSMVTEDTGVADILGTYFLPIPTPKPATWRIGHQPLYTTLPVEDYPSVSCWGHDIFPEEAGDGGWAIATARMMVQAAVLASDMTFLSRFSYRYAAAIQEIVKETTLGGLAEEISTANRIDVSLAAVREHDDRENPWFVQSVLYTFNATLVIL